VQWQLLHVEKDDQVIRHNNNKTWETREKHPESILVQNISEKLFRGKIFVLFCWLGLVFITLQCVYYFCTIFVIHQKNWLRYHPLHGTTTRFRQVTLYKFFNAFLVCPRLFEPLEL
jgi:hypothetical protein